jgi:hypothetical protein
MNSTQRTRPHLSLVPSLLPQSRQKYRPLVPTALPGVAYRSVSIAIATLGKESYGVGAGQITKNIRAVSKVKLSPYVEAYKVVSTTILVNDPTLSR